MKMKRKIIEVGNSLAITIPADVIESYGVEKGTVAEIEPRDFEDAIEISFVKDVKTEKEEDSIEAKV